MAFPTAVNSQITDAITQSNVKVVAESPAMAMGNLYQSLAHSTGILFENAVAAQQQQNTLAQAAANQGVIQIYSLDTTAAAAATGKIAQSNVPDNLTSLLTALHAMQSAPKAMAGSPDADLATTTPAAADASGVPPHDTGPERVASQIHDAVTFANDTVLGSNTAFIDGVRAAVEAMAHALETIDRSAHEARVKMLQEAALAATLAAMLHAPAQAKEYETVLQVIQRMG